MKNDQLHQIYELFPEVEKDGTITRKQCVKFEEHYGKCIRGLNPTSKRGVYSLSALSSNIIPIHKETENTNNMYIPEPITYFVSFGVYHVVNKIISSEMFFPVHIVGPTSNGKTTAVQQSCAVNKRPFIRVNLNEQTDEEMLIGSKTLVDGNVKIVDGPVVIAMRTGAVLLLDEIDAANANLILSIQSVLEGEDFYFKLNNEWITPAKGFNIIATSNTDGQGEGSDEYVGTNILNEAFLERFGVTLHQSYPTSTVETKILERYAKKHQINISELFLKVLIQWSETIRKTAEVNGTSTVITTRRLLHILDAYSIFGNEKESVKMCINRLLPVIRESYYDLFNKLYDGELIVTSKVTTPEDAIPF